MAARLIGSRQITAHQFIHLDVDQKSDPTMCLEISFRQAIACLEWVACVAANLLRAQPPEVADLYAALSSAAR
jgi:hypothetical protein